MHGLNCNLTWVHNLGRFIRVIQSIGSLKCPLTSHREQSILCSAKKQDGILLSALGRKSCFLPVHHSSPVNKRDLVHLMKYVWWSRMFDKLSAACISCLCLNFLTLLLLKKWGEGGEREGKGRKGLLLKLISSASNQNVNLFKSKWFDLEWI